MNTADEGPCECRGNLLQCFVPASKVFLSTTRVSVRRPLSFSPHDPLPASVPKRILTYVRSRPGIIFLPRMYRIGTNAYLDFLSFEEASRTEGKGID